MQQIVSMLMIRMVAASCGNHITSQFARQCTLIAQTLHRSEAGLMSSAVDTKAQLRAGQLLEAVSNAERERAAAPDEVPLGEWTAFRVRPSLTLQSLTTQLQLTITHSPSAQVRRATAAFAFSCRFSSDKPMSLLHLQQTAPSAQVQHVTAAAPC